MKSILVKHHRNHQGVRAKAIVDHNCKIECEPTLHGEVAIDFEILILEKTERNYHLLNCFLDLET